MSETLSAVWQQVEKLIDFDLSLIPIRDKQQGDKPPKSPYGKWQHAQHQRYTRSQLYDLMANTYDTAAVGIVCGAISGNLEAIDIDSKHKPGIDAKLFNDIKTLYPDLLDRLRIHKTPSGGYHILYRCEDVVQGNLKLAGRPADDSERITKPHIKTYHFLETRGEGGYVAAPPSLGYKIAKEVPIPKITKIERESLIQLCRNYDEIPKIEKPIKPNRTEQSIYDTDPFTDFNFRCDATELMESLGFTFVKQNNNFIWYTRPGGTKGHTHLSFNKEKRFFYVFTASTELDPSKGYAPSMVAAKLMFQDDRKRLYQWLVQQGYGKVTAKVEQNIVKSTALTGGNVQANFSNEAKENLQQLKAQILQEHPFGIFWERDEDDKIILSREKLYTVCLGLGFRLHNGDIYRIQNKFLHYQEPREFYDAVKGYIHEEDGDLYEDICNSYETFIQHNGKFTIDRLPLLGEDEYITDSRTHSNKFYLNGWLTITANSITFAPYDTLQLMVFYTRVQQRDYTAGHAGGKYVDFLTKACELPVRENHIKSILGFLSHEFKDETTGFIIILTEQVQNPKEGGGSGKNVFCNLLKNTTTYISKAGAQTKYDEKFFQVWNGQKVFAISDAPEHFDFLFLKEPATGDIVQKKLFKNEVVIGVKNAPKFIVQTNYSYEVSDGGLRRRMHAIEFTDFFTRCGGVDVHYDCHFPLGWDANDWAGYDAFIAESVQYWIKSGLKIQPAELTETGWQKQFEHTYGANATGFIRSQWESWQRREWVSNDDFKNELEKYWNDNAVAKNYQPSGIKMNRAIKEWCEHKSYLFQSDLPRRNGLVVEKFRNFTPFVTDF